MAELADSKYEWSFKDLSIKDKIILTWRIWIIGEGAIKIKVKMVE